jgi:hypothetical protein
MIEITAKCEIEHAKHIQDIVKNNNAYFKYTFEGFNTFHYCVEFPSNESYAKFYEEYDIIFNPIIVKEKTPSKIKKLYNKLIGTFKNIGA